MKGWKKRIAALLTGFIAGLLVVLCYSFLLHYFHHRTNNTESSGNVKCSNQEVFAKPEEVLSAMRSDNVDVRRELYVRLFLRPGVETAYYDYERDRDYPPRAEAARLRYVQLDDSPEEEALITFARYENPAAVILKRDSCGWNVVATLGSWLRLAEYTEAGWLELPETIRPGVHEVLIHESAGDAARYVRTARLLKLFDNSLRQIARFTEDEITPLENYREPDWNDVKRRRTQHYSFVQSGAGQTARVRLETITETIKYSAAPPTDTYWLETDGAWHTAHRHWNARPAVRLKLLDSRTEELIWNEERKSFVEAG